MGATTTEANRVMRRREVSEITGLSRSTLYEVMSAGTFPKPLRLGPRAVGWLKSDIDAWLDERKAASRASA